MFENVSAFGPIGTDSVMWMWGGLYVAAIWLLTCFSATYLLLQPTYLPPRMWQSCPGELADAEIKAEEE